MGGGAAASSGGGGVAESKESFTTYLSLERFKNAAVQDVMGRPSFGTRNVAAQVYKGFSLFHVFEVRRDRGDGTAAAKGGRRRGVVFVNWLVVRCCSNHVVRCSVVCLEHGSSVRASRGDHKR
jgi:hypothetical protein